MGRLSLHGDIGLSPSAFPDFLKNHQHSTLLEDYVSYSPVTRFINNNVAGVSFKNLRHLAAYSLYDNHLTSGWKDTLQNIEHLHRKMDNFPYRKSPRVFFGGVYSL
jgi:hypothetical protein